MSKNRRSFLKNTGLGLFGTGILLPTLSRSESNHKNLSEDQTNCNPTTQDYYGEGPFYSDGPPEIGEQVEGANLSNGIPLIISGRVLNLDCMEYIPNTVVDIWHADHEGQYDNEGFNFRGFTKSNDQGFYLFKSIVPGKYLNGGDFRPSHIHFKIKPPNFPLLTTQLYFEGDDKIEGDAAASINSGTFDATNRIISLMENADGVMEGQFDIVVDGDGITVGTQDIHLDKGMIYNVFPNPFDDKLVIKYGVFKKTKVGILVYNIEGQKIATLEDRIMSANKYEATWLPEQDLKPGNYFISIRVNDLQVHYVKVFKK